MGMLLGDAPRLQPMAGGESSSRMVGNFGLGDEVVSLLKNEWGIEELYPPQAQALPHALAGENLLLAIPTASGKTLIAYLAIFRRLLVDEPGSRAYYIVPLKALASEKVEELREAGAALGLSVGMAIGDRSGETGSLEDADIVVATSEKFDSLLRNRADLLSNTSVVIADEVHLIHDRSRGPTLEVNLARVMMEKPEAQIIALSATVGNAEAIADWLGATLIESDWRPVTLRYGTVVDDLVEPRKQVGPEAADLPPPFRIEGLGDEIRSVLNATINDGGQLLCFRSTRRYAEGSAAKLGKWMRARLQAWANSEREEANSAVGKPEGLDVEARIARLAELTKAISNSEEGTEMSDTLAASIGGGVAFHHAGLTSSQRKLIETAFRDRLLFCICATPTLAAGVNLPARRVVVRDLTRWQDGLSQPLPRIEIHQMLGRAGRPSYDKIGDAWLISRSDEHADQVAHRYFEQPPEDIESKLATEPALRMHVLAAIATGGKNDRHAISQFFSHTFLARSLDADDFDERIDGIIAWLCENGFVDRMGEDNAVNERIRALNQAIADQTTGDKAAEEQWDDEIPPWAAKAQSIAQADTAGLASTTGQTHAAGQPPTVEIADDKTVPLRNVKRPAIVGFQRASDITTASQDSDVIPDPPAMTYHATRFGERVSRLYLDPLSGLILRDGCRRALEVICRIREDLSISPFTLLHLCACTPDFPPAWPSGAKQIAALSQKANSMTDQMLFDVIEVHRYWNEGGLEEATLVKGAWMVEEWCEEQPLRKIERLLGSAPGDLRVRVDHSEWLLYAAREIASHDSERNEQLNDGLPELIDCIDVMRKRVTNGCKEDLLALISMRGIGRVRARTMATHNLRTPIDVASMTEDQIAKLADERGWSPQLVDNVVKQAERIIRRR